MVCAEFGSVDASYPLLRHRLEFCQFTNKRFEVNSFVHKTPAELLVTRTLTGRLSQGVTQPVVCCLRGDDVFPVFKRRTEGSQSTGARGCLGPEHRRSFSTERVLGK